MGVHVDMFESIRLVLQKGEDIKTERKRQGERSASKRPIDQRRSRMSL